MRLGDIGSWLCMAALPGLSQSPTWYNLHKLLKGLKALYTCKRRYIALADFYTMA